MHNKNNLLRYSAVALAVASTMSQAVALEEITVTARKVSESLQEVPVSVTAFNAQSLERLGVDNISQISSATPGLQFDSSTAISGSRVSSSIFIRGIGQTDFTLVSDPGVGLYVDGVYVARSVGGVLDIIDVESVEVLRGPQGTLFGKNTIGGAINITSRAPADEFQGYAQLTLGTDSRVDFKVSADVPLSDTLKSRFTYANLNQDGYVKNLGSGEDLSDTDAQTARAIFQWDPSDSFTSTLSFDWTDRDEQAQAQRLLAFNPGSGLPVFAIGAGIAGSQGVDLEGIACFGSSPVDQARNASECATPHQTFGGSNTPSKAEVFGTSLTLEWDLGNVQLKSITGYRELEALFARDTDNSPLVIAETIDNMDQEQFSQEIQLTGSAIDDQLKWLLGGYYFQEEGNNRNDVIVPFFFLKSGGDIDNDSTALFGQVTYDFTDDWSLTVGARRTEETKRFLPDQFINLDFGGSFANMFLDNTLQFANIERGVLPAGIPGPFPVSEFDLVPSVQVEEDFEETTGLISLDYQATDTLLLYGRYATGFKSGGFNQRIGPPGLPEPLSYQPETSNSFELGWKWENDASTVRLNGSVYKTDYEDLQINVFAGVAPTTLNATSAEIQGAEVELLASLTEALTLTANFAYTDAEYTEVGPESPVQLDTPFPKTPEFTAFIAADYSMPISDKGDLNFHIDWSYRDDTYNNTIASEEIKQESFDLINAAVSYDTEKYSITLSARNLTDEIYLIAGNQELAGFGYSEGVFSRGREWMLSGKYRF